MPWSCQICGKTRERVGSCGAANVVIYNTDNDATLSRTPHVTPVETSHFQRMQPEIDPTRAIDRPTLRAREPMARAPMGSPIAAGGSLHCVGLCLDCPLPKVELGWPRERKKDGEGDNVSRLCISFVHTTASVSAGVELIQWYTRGVVCVRVCV